MQLLVHSANFRARPGLTKDCKSFTWPPSTLKVVLSLLTCIHLYLHPIFAQLQHLRYDYNWSVQVEWFSGIALTYRKFELYAVSSWKFGANQYISLEMTSLITSFNRCHLWVETLWIPNITLILITIGLALKVGGFYDGEFSEIA